MLDDVEVRAAYQSHRAVMDGRHDSGLIDGYGAEFDEWLAEQRAAAFDRARWDLQARLGETVRELPNPYRKRPRR